MHYMEVIVTDGMMACASCLCGHGLVFVLLADEAASLHVSWLLAAARLCETAALRVRLFMTADGDGLESVLLTFAVCSHSLLMG